jgi:hypothetical protein
MRRFLHHLEVRSVSFLLQHSVQIVDNRGGSLFAMRENSIREHVMQQEKISYQYIVQISHIRCIIRTTGGVMLGILWAMGESLIFLVLHLSSFGSWWRRYRGFLYWMDIVIIVSTAITPGNRKTATWTMLHERMRNV